MTLTPVLRKPISDCHGNFLKATHGDKKHRHEKISSCV